MQTTMMKSLFVFAVSFNSFADVPISKSSDLLDEGYVTKPTTTQITAQDSGKTYSLKEFEIVVNKKRRQQVPSFSFSAERISGQEYTICPKKDTRFGACLTDKFNARHKAEDHAKFTFEKEWRKNYSVVQTLLTSPLSDLSSSEMLCLTNQIENFVKHSNKGDQDILKKVLPKIKSLRIILRVDPSKDDLQGTAMINDKTGELLLEPKFGSGRKVCAAASSDNIRSAFDTYYDKNIAPKEVDDLIKASAPKISDELNKVFDQNRRDQKPAEKKADAKGTNAKGA